MKTNYQAVVAEYHVEEESSDLDLEDEEKEGLVSNSKPSKWSRQSHHLWGEGHQSFAMNAISSSDSDEGKVIAIVTPNSLFDLKKQLKWCRCSTIFLKHVIHVRVRCILNDLYTHFLLLT